MLHLLVVASTAPAKPEITQCNAARHGSDPGATAKYLLDYHTFQFDCHLEGALFISATDAIWRKSWAKIAINY